MNLPTRSLGASPTAGISHEILPGDYSTSRLRFWRQPPNSTSLYTAFVYSFAEKYHGK
jgi:hypothetical protein